ncbi:hypothetical protein [Mesorhizobium sophorae]|uniref:hypothetical protein n=1 Tax=Mesorhizobium sophorae TaxID=1300294 RepID=UPI001FD9FFB6|nr:hypothetical protein [Mesorhizobium sophorae]
MALIVVPSAAARARIASTKLGGSLNVTAVVGSVTGTGQPIACDFLGYTETGNEPMGQDHRQLQSGYQQPSHESHPSDNAGLAAGLSYRQTH